MTNGTSQLQMGGGGIIQPKYRKALSGFMYEGIKRFYVFLVHSCTHKLHSNRSEHNKTRLTLP